MVMKTSNACKCTMHLGKRRQEFCKKWLAECWKIMDRTEKKNQPPGN